MTTDPQLIEATRAAFEDLVDEAPLAPSWERASGQIIPVKTVEVPRRLGVWAAAAVAAAIGMFVFVGGVAWLIGVTRTEVVDQPTSTIPPTTTTPAPTATAATTMVQEVEIWNPILATTRSKPVPTAATCPSDTDPSARGPVDQERPETPDEGVSLIASLTAAFDQRAGRIVAFDTPGDTWTFDVCTNTWYRMNPTGAMIGQLFGAGLVYDVDSDLTVALGVEQISVYDAKTDTWTQPENGLVGIGDGLITPFGAAYDPISGLVVTTTMSESSQFDWEFWAYDVDTNEWTRLGPLRLEPSMRDQLDFLGYSKQLDRLIVTGYVDGENATVLVDPRTGDVTVLPIESPVIDFAWPNAAYGPAAGTVYAEIGIPYQPHDICGFEAGALTWSDCFDTPAAAQTIGQVEFATMTGDPINHRLILIRDDVWAIDLSTGEWTQLLEPSSQ